MIVTKILYYKHEMNYIEKEHKKVYWLISSNDNIFKLEECLSDNSEVDWHGNFHPKIGDIVFIYRTKPIQRICYMMEVTKVNIPFHESVNDDEYKGEKHELLNITPEEFFHRLKKLKETTSQSLHLKELQKNGLKGTPQGPRKLPENLVKYILSVFESEVNVYDELDTDEGYFEGTLKKVYVNHYERDREARNKCIKAHGCKCSVCGMDFEKMYGELGQGFIHVHHIVPISKIGKEYKIDPINDLVPVCPNCHAMLHRGKDGKVYRIDELKEIIAIKK